ncbi:kielin/chordin-like protein [Ostrea edulis]|uniref:kielin/chordin-like protein n=1 Tax=Ostrea edulis TaxID=37623 RepID=UPI0024AEB5BA|nr:kielin/chordin-like protein [Ostrea edulis]
MLVFFVTLTFAIVSLIHGRSYYPQTPDYLKCRYGKYFKDIGQRPTCNPFAQSCPSGFFCGGGPADEQGFCCKSKNPCKLGNPYTRNGDAPHCLGANGVRCPRGYACIGTKTSSSVCCRGCTYHGQSYQPRQIFQNSVGQRCTCGEDGQVTCSNSPVTCRANGREYKVGESFRQDCNGCTCRSDGQIVCTLIACETNCYHNGKKYSKGESFPSTDGCNTCTCGSNGSVGCTKISCPKFCYYRGRKYTPRESFPAIDGCNTCTCEVTGGVSCTEIGCNPGGYVG